MNIQFVRVPWDARAETDLAPAMGNKPDRLAWLAGQVTGFLAVLLGVYVDGERVGSLVTRFEIVDGVREVVLVAVGGKGPGVAFTRDLLPDVCDLAADWEADQVRAHTDRPGVARWLYGAGFYLSERRSNEEVFRKVLI